MKTMVAPSILACDFNNLGSEIEMINQSDAALIHFDVMDGSFVPNISFGVPICKAVQRVAKKPIDVHLMIHNPDQLLEAFVDAGAEYISVHIEAVDHLHRTIQRIKELGAKAGVAVNPHTSVTLLDDIIADLDLVCLMSVNPGFGGQKFIPNTLKKTKQLKEMIIAKSSSALIEIDGGVNDVTGQQLINAGADILVAGSFVFKSTDPKKTIQELTQLA